LLGDNIFQNFPQRRHIVLRDALIIFRTLRVSAAFVFLRLLALIFGGRGSGGFHRFLPGLNLLNPRISVAGTRQQRRPRAKSQVSYSPNHRPPPAIGLSQNRYRWKPGTPALRADLPDRRRV